MFPRFSSDGLSLPGKNGLFRDLELMKRLGEQ